MASILSKIFKPKAKTTNKGFNDVVTMVYEPNFSKFGSSTLYSSLIYSAIQMKARYFAKLDPRHIRNENGKVTSINDSSIAKVLKDPNHYQTTYDFLAQAYFMRRKDKTCYIYADYYKTKGGEKKLDGLYILLPQCKPVIKEDPSGNLTYIFAFSGYSSAIEFDYEEIIVWKDNLEDNQYMGGGTYDTNANVDLYTSLVAYHDIKEAIKEAAKIGCMFEGYLKINAFTAGTINDKSKQIRDDFVKDIKEGNHIPVLDNGADYTELKRQLKMVDAATLKEIKEAALISEGVTVEMLTGKMTTQDKEAFYENHIEPAAISLAQAMSKVFFSQWQTTHGDQIILYPHKVQLMATSEIVSIIQNTISAGVFKIDEYREMLGYAPLPNGEGEQRPRGFNNLDGSTTNNNGGVTE